jgi:glycosyltransferase involved in cell wall biosynthesis
MTPRGNGRRISLFFNYFTFAFFASMRALFIKGHFDKIIVFEPSPITVGIPALVSKFKFNAPIFFWVQDLWPESLTGGGGVKNKYIINIFNSLTIYIYAQCHKILIQSRAFKPYIIKQNVSEDKLVYLPNSTESFYKKLEIHNDIFYKIPNGFKIVFAGNLGEAQSFDTILGAMDLLVKDKIKVQLIILGNGRMKNYIQKKILELNLNNNVHLLGSFESTYMPAFFSSADALLVSLKKDFIFSLTIPSKIQSYMACGKPIIASLDGEGARIIKEADAGFTSKSEDINGLKESIIKLLSLSYDDQILLGNNAKKYFDKEFEREMLLDKLELILS